MSDLDHWTTAHDDTLRDALALMRREVEALPISDVRFVKARGNTRRHRTFAVGAAATAAVFLLVGFVGFNAMGSDRAVHQLRPAVNTSTSISPPVSLGASGPLLTESEWKRTLGLTTNMPQLSSLSAGGSLSPCVGPPGTPLGFAATLKATGIFSAGQGTYRATSPVVGDAAAAKAVSQLVSCKEDHWGIEADAAWPKVFSSIGTGGKTWFIVAHEGELTSLLSMSVGIDSGSGKYTVNISLAQVQALAQLAQQRLVPTTGGDPVTAVPVAAAGPQLEAFEWQSALGTKAVQLGSMRPGEPVSTCLRPPGTQLAIGTATTKTSGFYGVQGTYRATSPDAGNAAAAKAVSQLVACRDARDLWKVEAGAAWPKVLSTANPDGKSWFIVAHQGVLTSLLALSDPVLGGSKTEAPHFSLAQIQALGLAAQQRLVQEVERGTTP